MPEQKACIFGCALFVFGASPEGLVCEFAQSEVTRTRCAPTPQTQNLRVTAADSPARTGLPPGMPDAPT